MPSLVSLGLAASELEAALQFAQNSWANHFTLDCTCHILDSPTMIQIHNKTWVEQWLFLKLLLIREDGLQPLQATFWLSMFESNVTFELREHLATHKTANWHCKLALIALITMTTTTTIKNR